MVGARSSARLQKIMLAALKIHHRTKRQVALIIFPQPPPSSLTKKSSKGKRSWNKTKKNTKCHKFIWLWRMSWLDGAQDTETRTTRSSFRSLSRVLRTPQTIWNREHSDSYWSHTEESLSYRYLGSPIMISDARRWKKKTRWIHWDAGTCTLLLKTNKLWTQRIYHPFAGFPTQNTSSIQSTTMSPTTTCREPANLLWTPTIDRWGEQRIVPTKKSVTDSARSNRSSTVLISIKYGKSS